MSVLRKVSSLGETSFRYFAGEAEDTLRGILIR